MTRNVTVTQRETLSKSVSAGYRSFLAALLGALPTNRRVARLQLVDAQ